MFCNKCGTRLETGDPYCGECGAKVETLNNDQAIPTVPKGTANEPLRESMPKKKKKTRLFSGIAVILAVLIAGGAFAYINFLSPEAKYEKNLELGQKFLMDENYEQAIVAMKKAIDIDEMRPEAYVALAGAYAARSDENTVEDICDVLEKGYEKTESDTIIQAFADLADQLADQEKVDWAIDLLNFGYELTEDEGLKEKIAELEEKELFFLKDIGKTLNTIEIMYPLGVYFEEAKAGASANCLGDPSKNYSCYFFSTQSVPSLIEMAAGYGDKLKCAGIATTVEVLFPQTSDDMPIADFFAAIGVSDYLYWDDPNADWISAGWIEFEYKGRKVYLDTLGHDNFKKVSTIKSGYYVLICDQGIIDENNELHNLAFSNMYE